MKTKKRAYVMTARSAKADATRQRICESVMTLYRERSMDSFTLDDVAARAGTTVQTVLRAFKSKDNLVIEALDRFTKRDSPFVADRPGGFAPTPPGDVAAAVAAIVDVYETVGDLAMRNLSNLERNPALKAVTDLGRHNHLTWVKSVFAPQLKARGGAERTRLFNCLVVATDLYTWKILRRDQGLSRSATEAVVRQIITAVSNGENTDVTSSMAELVGRRQPAA
jgi:AcrR family transcriptional regulator